MALGLGASILLVLLVEFADPKLKTADDISRVTDLPVLTSLGDLQATRPQDRAQWAFRTWTLLQGWLSPSPNHGLVCGITSSASGEGRSAWINLLAQAASLTGFRVLTIATRPSQTHVDSDDQIFEESASRELEDQHESTTLTSNILAAPAKVTEQLTGPDAQPVVHIPLPGWVWNLERRNQWHDALNHWAQIPNLVIFVELPPASVAETVLLGSHLPNLIWLASSGTPHAGETRAQLETLRHARCNLVGAVLNRQAAIPLRNRFPRWVAASFGIALLSLVHAAAQTNVPTQAPSPGPVDQPRTNLGFSIIRPSQRASWQQHLTVGPGDVLNFGLYDHPELTRTEVAIGPDGHVGYLEAQDIAATGLTIDELRARFDEELGKYRRAPHTIITPVTFKSKKYYMLGKVATKGVYTLDRPVTVLEALARAHGLESALIDRNLVRLVDFDHSFLAREGKRISLNFEKLFQQGDLGQNIPVAPGDYIFFAPGDIPEVYVVGEVRLPGVVTYYQDLTIIGAIAARGGYTPRGYKARVVVLRGPLDNPQKIAVDTHGILDAKEVNFKLRPRDVIFVNSRPFIQVEEIADLAATAFIQSIIASWVGVDVVQPFTR